MLKSCSPNLTPPALQSQSRRESPIHDRQGNWSYSRLDNELRTLFVSCSEVVLHCLDDIRLDIFLLFESDGSAINKLPVFVVSEAGRGCGRLSCRLGNFV